MRRISSSRRGNSHSVEPGRRSASCLRRQADDAGPRDSLSVEAHPSRRRSPPVPAGERHGPAADRPETRIGTSRSGPRCACGHLALRLEGALRSGTFDVVLANVTHAPELEKAQSVAERNAVVLPAIYLVAPGFTGGEQAAVQSLTVTKHRRTSP